MLKKYTLFISFISLFLILSAVIPTEGNSREQMESVDPVSPLLSIIPSSTPDTTTAALGLPNPLIQNDFNIFFNPSQIMNYGTAYGEVWKAGEVWGGATVRLPLEFKLGIFLG
ncbi:MAG: hypothetical protein PHF84_12220, partial [bacterium]|nr:hypothetical protein [bacterium]